MDRKMTPLSLHFPNFDQIDQANNSLRRKLIGSDDDDDDGNDDGNDDGDGDDDGNDGNDDDDDDDDAALLNNPGFYF